MTKTEYHSILIHKLEQASSDIITFPGFSPGAMIPTVMMDDLSESSLTNSQRQPIVEELELLSHEPDSEDFQNRHDKFLEKLDTFNPDPH
jgi:hypothetical protein